jgi:hypothetical protein
MAIDARNRNLPDWFTRIRTRQTVLPRFQRFEAWSHANVNQLFNTILQDLPAGALLILEIGDTQPFISRTIKGAPTEGERVTEHLLDGQQRLTALWRGLHNNYDDRTYFLYLRTDDETGTPCYVDSIARWRKPGDTADRPFWANSPKEQWARRMIPLDLMCPTDETWQRFRQWTKEAIEDADERERIVDQVTLIRSKFAVFNLPYLSLPVTTPRETALDVFIRMNTSAAPLSIYDIVVAQVEAGMGESLHELVGQLRDAAPAIADYYSPDNLALYAGALLQGRAPVNATYMDSGFAARLLENWQRFLIGAKRTVEFLEDERVYDAARLPTDLVVPVLVALWAEAPEYLDAEGRARSILRKYLWRAFFSNRYEKSTGSRSMVDYTELKALIGGDVSRVPAVFDDVQHPLPPVQELILAGWPKKKDRLARAILAVALRDGGLDLADGGSVSRANLAKREYHHLFPDAHLKRSGFSDDKIYRSLNCAVVTWRTNRNISDKEPERYLAERRDGHELGEAEIRARLASHLIPYQELVAGDYEAFLAARAGLVFDAMNRLCVPSGAS